MQKQARILFYNTSEGNGIVITRQKEKFDFSVTAWNDFDTMPQVGLDVVCDFEHDLITSIKPFDAGTPPFDAAQNIPSEQRARDKQEDEKNSLALWEKNRAKIDVIRLNVPVNTCVEQYFKKIDEDIDKRTGYKNAAYRLDYLKMRRFLFTMYNNLIELDMHFITPRIKTMRDDLIQMSSVYDDFRSKATYPEIAFEKVFLSRQDEYQLVKHDAELAHAEYSRLVGAEERLSEMLEEKEEVLERTLRSSPIFERLEEEHKELKSDYVDTVHMMATLDEAYRHDTELMMAFEQQYKETFFRIFDKASKQYRKQIVHILDAQAYLFDEQLWMQAQKSKIIQSFFEEAHIEGDYSSKTFLKYYLNSLDPEKISEEQRELFKLYEYLETIARDVVVAVVKDVESAFAFKALFVKIAMPIEYQVFVDTRKAFAWLQKHRASVLMCEEKLDKITSEGFIKQFQEKIGSRAACVLISAHKTQAYPPYKMVIKPQISGSDFKECLLQLLKEFHG